MIIPEASSQDKEMKEMAGIVPTHRDDDVDDDGQVPPPYSPSTASFASPALNSAAPPVLDTPPPNLSPCNYVIIDQKNSGVKGQYLVDLTLLPPPASLHATPPSADNLNLESHNGSVSADVWIIGSGEAPSDAGGKIDRARLRMTSHNGSVKGKVYIPTSPRNQPRPYLTIDLQTHNGSASLSIPRSFRGQLTLYTQNGRAVLSRELAPRAAMLSNVNGARTYFVGERPAGNTWRTGNGTGVGELVDDASLGSKNGSVNVRYNDEEEGSFFGSLLKSFKS